MDRSDEINILLYDYSGLRTEISQRFGVGFQILACAGSNSRAFL